jgi:RHS repeat-associated protein
MTGDTLVETDLSGNLRNEYVFVAGRRIAQRTSAGVVYYYFVDQLSSTRVITDSQEHKCYDTDYLPFGLEAGPYTNTCSQNYKFTGFERDAETGLDYAFTRYYNPRIGRFMSPDRFVGNLGNPQSLNRYAYALDQLSNLTDATGTYPQDRHPFITFLLAVLAGREDAGEIAEAAAAQDDFSHATTGLFGLGAIVNFSSHFGAPCSKMGCTVDRRLKEWGRTDI